MPTRKATSEVDQRDSELENIHGNLLIAEYQVEKLKGRLVEKITPVYGSSVASNHSSYSFKAGGKWYRVSLRVEEEPELHIKTSEI